MESQTKITQLSVWNRVQYREHISIALPFKTLPGTSQAEIRRHVGRVVDRVSVQRPDLAGRVVLGGPSVNHPSHVSLHTTPGSRIPLSLIGAEYFPIPLGKLTYDKLEASDFPASWFVDARLRLPRLDANNPSAPVTAVKLCFLPGGSGFVMFVHLHHSYGDGACMAEFLQLLGTASCELVASPACPPPTPHDWESRLKLDLPRVPDLLSRDFASLLASCPEIKYPNDTPRLSSPTTARTFTLSRSRLVSFANEALSPGVRGSSPFFILSAFLWAWTTRARKAANPAAPCVEPPIFFNPNNWSTKNLFPSSAPAVATHFGNTVVTAPTTLHSTSNLLHRATEDPAALLDVAAAIAAGNDAVDADFVLTRDALFAATEEMDVAPMVVGAMDPRPPHNFSVNTWGFLGKDVAFGGIPGVVGGGAPAAVRRVQAAWATAPHGLILPGRDGLAAGEVDVVVTVEEKAMEVLLGAGEMEGFRRFVTGVSW